MKIRSVALIGAGAIGGYLIWGFDSVPDVTFTVVAEGSRRERLERDGVVINGRRYPVRVREPGQAGAQDLIFIATKYGGLGEAVAMLPPLVGPDTLVLSLLNGVDSEEQVARAIGAEHVIHSLIRIASRRTQAGILFDPQDPVNCVCFGLPKDRADEQGKLEELSALLARTRLCWSVSEDIMTEIWVKYASNIANNLPQAVIGVPASLYSSEHGRFLAQGLWTETAAVAASRGIRLAEKVVIFPGNRTAAKYSTLQDLEAGRHTEIDMFAGQMLRMAAEAGISVPYCEYTYHAIKALEEKNDGLFDPR